TIYYNILKRDNVEEFDDLSILIQELGIEVGSLDSSWRHLGPKIYNKYRERFPLEDDVNVIIGIIMNKRADFTIPILKENIDTVINSINRYLFYILSAKIEGLHPLLEMLPNKVFLSDNISYYIVVSLATLHSENALYIW